MTHSHRRQKQARHTAGLGIAGGVLGVSAVALGVVLVRAHGQPAETTSHTRAAAATADPARTAQRPKTGPRLDVSTPDGFSYSLAAVKVGTAVRPLASSRTPPPTGSTLAYVDYVLTNTGTQPALLDFPADLFVKRSLVPDSARARCMPQPGVPADMCTLPDNTDVVNTLGYEPPKTQDEDQYIPAGASYLVRVATDLPVGTGTGTRDLGLYVWNPRFTHDRHAVQVPIP